MKTPLAAFHSFEKCVILFEERSRLVIQPWWLFWWINLSYSLVVWVIEAIKTIFKPAFFFLKKNITHKKYSQTKISEQKTTKAAVFYAQRLLRGRNRLLGLVLFVSMESFHKKINKFKIVLIASITYATDVYLPQPTDQASIYAHLFLFVIICENFFFS